MRKIHLLSFIVLSFMGLNCMGQTPTNLRNDFVSILVGEWINVNPEGALTKVIITKEENKLWISAFGDCEPVDCEWGKVKLHEIVGRVEVPFDYLYAIFEIDGQIENELTEIMKITLKTSSNTKYYRLYIENTGLFNGNYERKNYHDSYIMKKKK